MTFKAGIIGCGSIFPMHAYSLKSLPNCELAAVCDIRSERAKSQAEQFHCGYYTDYKEMISAEHLDAVHVCTPHYLHPPITIYALEHGCNVLTEKPMSVEYKDAVSMVEAAERTGLTLGVIFQNRFNPGSQLAKRMLESGRLGRVLGAKFNVTWARSDEYYSDSDWKGTWDKEGGGVMINQSIHTFDLLRWLIGSEPAYVDCHITNRTHRQVEVEDEADGLIRFQNGVDAIFFATISYSRDSEIHLQIDCENGLVDIYGERGEIQLRDGQKLIADKPEGEYFDYGTAKDYWGVSHRKEIADFYHSLETGKAPYVNAQEVLGTMKMLTALYQSGKTRKPVSL
jgi:predicted dehydrogenase